MALTIVGLGPGDLDALSLRAWRLLQQADTVYLRTSRHNCAAGLTGAGIAYDSFDTFSERGGDLVAMHQAIAECLVEAAQTKDVVYGVPGDPVIDEPTTPHVRARAKQAGIAVEVVPGISLIEPALAALGVEALDGLQILNGMDIATLHHPLINPDYPVLIGQIEDRATAANVKRVLLNQYSGEFIVKWVFGAGPAATRVQVVPLTDIDQNVDIGPATLLYVPRLGEMSSFEQFQEVVAHLRAPDGCPWDRKQTHTSLRQYLLEETYEVLEALDNEDPQALMGELGDLLLQIVLHTQIAIDNGEFNMTDVLRNVNQKMIRRHPHVWSTTTVENADEVLVNWEAIKREEKVDNGQQLLDSIPKTLPALLLSYQYQARAAKVGFDWPKIADVRTKIIEELDEVLAAETDAQRADEIGDVLFVMVNWARWLKVEPESALRETAAKFYRRFQFVEQRVRESGRPMTNFTLAELDDFWDEAKVKGL